MSFENDPRLPGGPIANVTPPRSGKKWWLFGGCGCLSIMALVCVGFLTYVYYSMARPLVEFTNENVALAKDSQQVADALGPPIQLTGDAVQKGTDTPGVLEIRTPVSGTNGSGTIVVRAKMGIGDGGMTWQRDSLQLEYDGKVIDLNPDQELTPELEISPGN